MRTGKNSQVNQSMSLSGDSIRVTCPYMLQKEPKKCFLFVTQVFVDKFILSQYT